MNNLFRRLQMNKQEEEEARLKSMYAIETPLSQESDMKSVMKELNQDILEDQTALPSIDMKTRLHPTEISSMVIHDTIVALDCLPNVCTLTTRVKKRLQVSLMGKGREEIVRIVQGEREKQNGGGMMEGLKNWITPNNQ